jgi:restriction system protein
MPRKRANDSVLDGLIESFVARRAKAGLVTAVGLFVLGWVLATIFPSGSGFVGLYAQGGRTILWILAALVALAALLGALRRRMDRDRFDSNVSLDDLSWSQFEGYLAEYFRRRRFSVTYRGGALADGGVDLVLDDSSGRRIVQAKHWKRRSVGVETLRALWGVLGDEGAQGAIVVTSGRFTGDAVRFAEGKQLELIGREQLIRLIGEVKGSAAPSLPGSGRSVAPDAASTPRETCPQCGRGVLERKLAQRGPNAGSYFLGCNRFPDCRYSRNV